MISILRRSLFVSLCILVAAGCGRIGFGASTDELDSGVLPDGQDARPTLDASSAILVNRGVIVRYPLTEDPSDGVVRSTAREFDLQVLDGANLSVERLTTGRGINFGQVGSDDRACADVGSGPLSVLEGKATGTIETVARVTDGHPSRSRLASIGSGILWNFSLGFSATDSRFIYSMDNSTVEYGRWEFDAVGRGRAVYTAVYDSDALVPADRVRLFVDGVEVDTIGGELIEPGAALAVGDARFCIGNRGIGARAIEGTIHYVAIYETALTPAEIASNAVELLLNDD